MRSSSQIPREAIAVARFGLRVTVRVPLRVPVVRGRLRGRPYGRAGRRASTGARATSSELTRAGERWRRTLASVTSSSRRRGPGFAERPVAWHITRTR